MSKNIGIYSEDAMFPKYVGNVCRIDTDIPKNSRALIVYAVYHANLENTAASLSAVPKTKS